MDRADRALFTDKDLLALFDKEGRGHLTKKEQRVLMSSINKVRVEVEDIHSLFSLFSGGTEYITVHTLSRLVTTLNIKNVTVEEIQQMVRTLDTENKNYLTVEDFQRLFVSEPVPGSLGAPPRE